MRFVLAFTAFVLLPGAASAQCVCACIQGQNVPVCAQQSLTPPICQQLCTPSLSQQIRTQPLAGGGGGGGGSDSQSQSELARTLGVAQGANIPLGTSQALSGAVQAPGVSGTISPDLGNLSGTLR